MVSYVEIDLRHDAIDLRASVSIKKYQIAAVLRRFASGITILADKSLRHSSRGNQMKVNRSCAFAIVQVYKIISAGIIFFSGIAICNSTTHYQITEPKCVAIKSLTKKIPLDKLDLLNNFDKKCNKCNRSNKKSVN